MKVSLILSVRQLHDGQNHVLSYSKIPGFKNLEKEELIFGDNGIVGMSNFTSLAEKQKHWLQETLILIVSEIKSLAATEIPFTVYTSAASYWELKLNGVWWDSEILQLRVFAGSTGLLDLNFILMCRVTDLRIGRGWWRIWVNKWIFWGF